MDFEENEFELLDMLIVVAENLKLLILGPIVAGFLALSVMFVIPKSYVSEAILSLPTTATPTPAQAAAMMVSPLVLDSVIESQQLSAADPIETARSRLRNQVKATANRDGLLHLDITASTPAQAQAIANAIIDSWLKSTVPNEQDRVDMEKRLAYATESLKSVRRLIERLASDKGGSFLSKTPLTRDEANMSIAALGELQARYFNEVLTIPRQIKGLSRDEVIKQKPTLATTPVSSSKGLIAVLAALGACSVILLWMYLRQVWRNVARDHQAAEKQARLLATLRLK